jgi:ATP-binding cassette subfamily C protein
MLKVLRQELGHCLSLVPKSDRHKISLLIFGQLFLAILDLIGVGLFGILAVVSISGIKSTSPGTRTSKVLDFFHLNNYSLSTQAIILSITALTLLIIKTTATYFVSRRILNFLSFRSALSSSDLLGRVLSKRILLEQESSQQEILYSITGGVNLIIVGVVGSLATLAADFFSLLILSMGLFFYNPFVTLVVGAYFIIIGRVNYHALHKKIVLQNTISTELSIQSNETILELISSYRELFLSGNEEHYLKRFSEERQGIAKSSASLAMFPNVSKYIVEISMLVGILSLSAYEFATIDAVRAIGAVSIFLAAGTRVAPSLLRIQQGLFAVKGNLAASRHSLNLVLKLKDETNELDRISAPANKDKTRHQIVFQNVSYRYKTDHKFLISDISFAVNQGQRVAIVGPSGSGKSTILDLLLALKFPDSGTILMENRTPLEFIRLNPGKVGFVPQHTNIVNDTMIRNIALGVAPRELDLNQVSRLVNALDLTGLQSVEEDAPRLGDRGGRLSGGQRQRIGIARALYSSPSILILDEATSSLDAVSESKIGEFLRAISSEVTTVTVAHRLSTVINSDLVLYFDGGRLIAKGTFAEVREQVPDFDTQAKLMGL